MGIFKSKDKKTHRSEEEHQDLEKLFKNQCMSHGYIDPDLPDYQAELLQEFIEKAKLRLQEQEQNQGQNQVQNRGRRPRLPAFLKKAGQKILSKN